MTRRKKFYTGEMCKLTCGENYAFRASLFDKPYAEFLTNRDVVYRQAKDSQIDLVIFLEAIDGINTKIIHAACGICYVDTRFLHVIDPAHE